MSYAALVAAWNSATLPAGVAGTALTAGMTTAQKVAAINAWTVAGPAQRAVLTPSQILNACDFTELSSLSALQVAQLTLLLQGNTVDASVGTTVRAGIAAIFSGKPATTARLTALVAPFDSPSIPWWQAPVAQKGAGLASPINEHDLIAAGILV